MWRQRVPCLHRLREVGDSRKKIKLPKDNLKEVINCAFKVCRHLLSEACITLWTEIHHVSEEPNAAFVSKSVEVVERSVFERLATDLIIKHFAYEMLIKIAKLYSEENIKMLPLMTLSELVLISLYPYSRNGFCSCFSWTGVGASPGL